MPLSATLFYPTQYKLAQDTNQANLFNPQGNPNVRMMLLTAVPNHQTVEYVQDVIADEVRVGTAYPARGVAVTNFTVTPGGNNVTWDMDDMSFAEDISTFFTAVAMVIYHDTTIDSTSRISLVINANGSFTNSAGVVNMNVNASGLLIR